MRRLYLRFYVAVLASLAVFAMVAGIAWRLGSDVYGPRQGASAALAGELAAELLPDGAADPRALHERFERWHARTGFDIALFDREQRLIADSGRAPPAPERGDSGWTSTGGGAPSFVMPLPGGRTLLLLLRSALCLRPLISRPCPILLPMPLPLPGGALQVAGRSCEKREGPLSGGCSPHPP